LLVRGNLLVDMAERWTGVGVIDTVAIDIPNQHISRGYYGSVEGLLWVMFWGVGCVSTVELCRLAGVVGLAATATR
jgi:hypothetical protein